MQVPRQRAFRITSAVKREIVSIVDERIREAHVTREDFSELKAIVKELAVAQKKTEQRVEELAVAQKKTEQRVEELAEAQKRTEERLTRLEQVVEELAEAQKRTEERLTRLEQVVEGLAEAQKRTEERLTRLEQVVEELAEAQKKTEEEVRKLATGLVKLRGEMGGLARSFGYAFENEAYRMLPKTLKERYGIELTERLIRTDIDDTEINILGLGVRDGREVVVVGEAKTRLEREEVFDELEEKVQVVKDRYSGREVVRVLVTHFAPKGMMRMAKERGVIVIQSFEWEV